MDYQVAVRTYERADQFPVKTLRVLRDAGMVDRLTVFVGSAIEPYREREPDLRYVQVRKGGANAIADICAHYPRDTPILFLDDDLESFYGGNLHELTQDGFSRASVWSFGFTTNKIWLQQAPEWSPRYATMPGCAFGARNCPELIVTPVAHCDDLLRTIQMFKAGIVPHVWRKAGFKTRYGKNVGGLQSSGERADTLAACESLLPLAEGWIRGMRQHPNGLWELRLLAPVTIKKRLSPR